MTSFTMEILVTEDCTGEGVDVDPVRRIFHLHTRNGILIATIDALSEEEYKTKDQTKVNKECTGLLKPVGDVCLKCKAIEEVVYSNYGRGD